MLHELGVIIEVVKTVEDIAIKNHLTKIDTIVLQIGELSSMIPKYIEECYPAAVDGTIMESTKLKIEILPGNALCKSVIKFTISWQIEGDALTVKVGSGSYYVEKSF